MEFSIGDKVFLNLPTSYLKTADNVPMLRPPDLVAQDELGEIIAIRAGEIVEVRFRRGTFLLSTDRLGKKNT